MIIIFKESVNQLEAEKFNVVVRLNKQEVSKY